MIKALEAKLNKVIEDNPKWPIVIEGVHTELFKNAVILSADISDYDLKIVNNHFSAWANELEIKAKNLDQSTLIIDGLTKLDATSQEKFLNLIKDRKAGVYKLPTNAQILIPIEVGTKSKLSKKLLKACYYWKACE